MSTPKLDFIKLDLSNVVVISALSILVIHLLFIILLYYSNTFFRYVRFSNNLSTLNKKTFVQIQIPEILTIHSLLLCLIFLSVNLELFILLLIQFEINTFHVNLQLCYKLLTLVCRFKKLFFKIIHYTIMLFIKSLYSWETFILWVILITILLSNDVEKNPGDFTNGFFSFCNWNLNSLAKDNFSRAQLLEAHNSIFDYDLISVCETSLDDSVELPIKLIEDYTFVPCNNPNNTRHGSVGLFL